MCSNRGTTSIGPRYKKYSRAWSDTVGVASPLTEPVSWQNPTQIANQQLFGFVVWRRSIDTKAVASRRSRLPVFAGSGDGRPLNHIQPRFRPGRLFLAFRAVLTLGRFELAMRFGFARIFG